MTTTTVPIEIVCPDWCERDPGTHAAELGGWEGTCIHQGLLAVVEDPSANGYDWDPSRPEHVYKGDPIEVGVGVITSPDGHVMSTPSLALNEGLHSIEQIEALIPWLQRAVDLAKGSTLPASVIEGGWWATQS